MQKLDIERILEDVLSDAPLPTVAAKPSKAAPTPEKKTQAPAPAKPAGKGPPVPGSAKGKTPAPKTKVKPEPEEEEPEGTPSTVFADTDKRTGVRLQMPTFVPEDFASTFDVRNFASLVTLNTARWHAKVKDRKAARDAAVVNEADENSFETRKRLLVGADDLLKRIHKVIDAARIKHYEMTLPWTTTGINDIGRRTGGRLLPNTLFFDYAKEMATFKQEMDAALDAFVPEYPNLVDIAKSKLGKRFDPSEYPNADVIRTHFALSFDFQPIPQGTDFKGLPDAQLSALARHINGNTRKMMENAMQEVWTRLREVVERMADRLSSPDKLFHYTLVENVRSTATLLNHLNVTNDSNVEEIRKLVEKNLCPHDVKDLRENSTLRTKVAGQAQSILDKMDKLHSVQP